MWRVWISMYPCEGLGQAASPSQKYSQKSLSSDRFFAVASAVTRSNPSRCLKTATLNILGPIADVHLRIEYKTCGAVLWGELLPIGTLKKLVAVIRVRINAVCTDRFDLAALIDAVAIDIDIGEGNIHRHRRIIRDTIKTMF